MEQEQQERGPLTVGDLIYSLRDMPADAIVVLASDAEGNDMNVFDGMDPTPTWDVKANDLAFNLRNEPPYAKPDGKNLRRCVILYPEHR